MELSISTDVTPGGHHVLQLSGALDLVSRDLLLEAGTAALASAGTKVLVLDTAHVDFLDSSGIGAIVALAGAAEDAGRGFALQAPSDRVTRVLTVTGLVQAWTILDAPT